MSASHRITSVEDSDTVNTEAWILTLFVIDTHTRLKQTDTVSKSK